MVAQRVLDEAYTQEHYSRCIIWGQKERDVVALRRCSAKGDVPSILKLAEILKARGDPEAAKLHHSVLDRPNGEGEYLVGKYGVMMKDRVVYSHRPETALEWLRKARAKGRRMPDQEFAGWLLSAGRYDEAASYLDAIVEEDVVAASRFAYSGDRALPNAVRWILPAAEAGDVLSQYRLAEMFRAGSGGVRSDQAAYERWTMRAAGNRRPWVHSLLAAAGLLENGGITVSRDREAALAMYRKALPFIDSSDGPGRQMVENRIAALEGL